MIELKKGSKINLSKTLQTQSVNSDKLTIGLGWNADLGRDIDCDAFVVMTFENGTVYEDECVVYYRNLINVSGSVQHMGDNLVGQKGGPLKDCEQIQLNLGKIPKGINNIALYVNIFAAKQRNQHLGMVHNAYFRVFDDTHKDLIRCQLDKHVSETCIHIANISRGEEGWELVVLEKGSHENYVGEVLEKYNVERYVPREFLGEHHGFLKQLTHKLRKAILGA